MEYILLIFEFFYSKRVRAYFGLIIIPVILSIVMYNMTTLDVSKNLNYGNIITLLGILLGFTVSLFAIFLSANNSNIRTSKTTMTEFTVLGKRLSVFDIMQTSIAYVLIIECMLLVANICIPLLLTETESIKLFMVINIAMVSHVVIILLRSLLDFYFALSKRN